MNEQTANSFDKASMKKLAKDVAILFGPQIALYVLQAMQSLDFGKYTALAGMIISTLIYVVKRYAQGTPQQ